MPTLRIATPARAASLSRCLVAAAGLLCCAGAWSQTFRLVEMASLAQGSATVVRGPNVSGAAVGAGRLMQGGKLGRDRRGLVLEGAEPREVDGLPGADYTTVFGLNDTDVLVGSSNTPTGVRAFVASRAGVVRALPPLPGHASSMAFAVNNVGHAAGYSGGPGGERATVWGADAAPNALPGPATTDSRAYGINERSDVAGVVGVGDARRATLWPRSGAPRALALLPGHVASEAANINSRGDVVGYSATAAGQRRATVWPGAGAPVDLGTLPGGTLSQAFGANDAGDIVGASTSSRGMRAVLWTKDGAMVDLNTLIAPAPLVLTKAVGINNAGMIVVLATETDGHEHEHEQEHSHELPMRVLLLVRQGN